MHWDVKEQLHAIYYTRTTNRQNSENAGICDVQEDSKTEI